MTTRTSRKAILKHSGTPFMREHMHSLMDGVAHAHFDSGGLKPHIDQQEALFRAESARAVHDYERALIIYDQLLSAGINDAHIFHAKGITLKEAGRLVDAEAVYTHVLVASNNTDACAFNNLGVLRKEAGLFSEAVQLYESALAVAPAFATARENLAVCLSDWATQLKQACDLDGAAAKYELAIRANPASADVRGNYALLLAERNRTSEAMAEYAHSLRLNPNNAHTHCNLGVLHKTAGRLQEAIACFKRAHECDSTLAVAAGNLAIALTDLGTQQKEAGDVKQAIRTYKMAVFYDASYAEAHYNLGVAYVSVGKIDRAIAMYNICVKISPSHNRAWNNCGVLHKARNNNAVAQQYYEKALAACPTFAEALNNLGVLHTLHARVDEALKCLESAIASNPRYADAYNNLGVLCRDEGRVPEALVAFERALSIRPTDNNAWHNRLLSSNYVSSLTHHDVFVIHEEWGRLAAAVAAKDRYRTSPLPCPPRSRLGRPLCIGYLSPDFFTHSVSYFIEPVLLRHNRARVRVICYSAASFTDERTVYLRALADGWRDVQGMPASEVARTIERDGVDVLVDLAGHTAGNRLDVIALRPAPVIATWIGYPNTTGLPMVQYRITDGIADPPDTKQQFTEKLLRLPHCFVCYAPPSDAPDVSMTRAGSGMSNGITFGSFNALAKVCESVYDAWAAILLQVPSSRLLLKAKAFASTRVRGDIEAKFVARGVAAERLTLVPLQATRTSHLQTYSLVDIALDTFPYAGTTTTCEAVWMGVPCVTLRASSNHAHCVGASLLTVCGYRRLVANTVDEYIAIAVTLANDLPLLATLRKELRPAMQRTLCDAEKFVPLVENAFELAYDEQAALAAAEGRRG